MTLENENFKLALNSALHKTDVSGSVLFANKSVDYSFTSPPYNRKRNDKYRDFTDINENWLQLNIDDNYAKILYRTPLIFVNNYVQ